MQTVTETKPIKSQTRPAPTKDVRKSEPRTPQPGGLTREELRAIVIELLG
jgi:hypothetical protein